MSEDEKRGDQRREHSHGEGSRLGAEAAGILERGLGELLSMAQRCSPGMFPSERYPFPLAASVYGEVPEPAHVREDVASRLRVDPVAALEPALVLVELQASARAEVVSAVPDDGRFLAEAFRSKRLNGWLALIGDADAVHVEKAVNAKWQFEFIKAPDSVARLYVLLNMLCRYGFIYGRIPSGDVHAMSHFIEEYTPGVVVCRGAMSDLHLSLSLAAMKLGVPAVVGPDYPFPFGRQIAAESMTAVVEGIVTFPNIRRLLDLPELPKLPDYLDPQNLAEDFKAATVVGDTDDSFFIFRKGQVVESDTVQVVGESNGAMGLTLTGEAEPLDAFDRDYIESRAARALSMMKGVRSRLENGRLIVELAGGVEFEPARLGEALIGVIRHEFPRIRKVWASLVFDRELLASHLRDIRAEQEARRAEMAAATEQSVERFTTCVGCSPFAPDHVCILTPERWPQCGRSYAHIKTGALYGYDDMTNIHHRSLHSGMNSFGTAPKGELIDSFAGEWSGINEAASRLTGGRTRRIQLHSLDDYPPTGCGCFRIIMFKTTIPRSGVGLMDRAYRGVAPDGRTWRDLHYALAGKQTPGIAGASPNYLRSGKFLQAHGGWESVVWVSPAIARNMGDDLPDSVQVGPESG